MAQSADVDSPITPHSSRTLTTTRPAITTEGVGISQDMGSGKNTCGIRAHCDKPDGLIVETSLHRGLQASLALVYSVCINLRSRSVGFQQGTQRIFLAIAQSQVARAKEKEFKEKNNSVCAKNIKVATGSRPPQEVGFAPDLLGPHTRVGVTAQEVSSTSSLNLC